MRVISEEKLVGYLGRVLDLSGEILPLLSEQGTQPPPEKIETAYRALIESLDADRSDDPCLQDESWNWIFDPTESVNMIKIYGRLAWINLQLLDLM